MKSSVMENSVMENGVMESNATKNSVMGSNVPAELRKKDFYNTSPVDFGCHATLYWREKLSPAS